MRRLSASAWLLMLTTALPLSAAPERPRLRAVRFTGREVLPRETLLGFAGIRPGEAWPENGEVKVIERLAQVPFVEVTGPAIVVPAEQDSVELIVPIREKLTVAKVVFDGNEALDRRRLHEVSGLRRGAPYDTERRDTARKALLAYYHGDGFLFASIEARTRAVGTGAVQITFRIRERYRVHIREVTLTGTSADRAAAALRTLRMQPRRLFGVVARGYYAPDTTMEELNALARYFHGIGFLGAVVELDGLEMHRNYRQVSLRLRVREGPRWKLAAVRVEGHELFPTRRLEEVVDLATGVYYSHADVVAGAERLVSWYQEHADRVPAVRILPPEYDDNLTVTQVFQIDERKHLVVRDVKVSGNHKTRDRVVRQDVILAPGEPFTLLDLERSLKRIRRRGHFQKVDWASEQVATDNPDVDEIDVELRVEERPHRGLLQAGGGASSGEGELAYFAVHQPNFDLFRLPRSWEDRENAFVGGGQQLDVELIPGNRESEYRVRFIEPYFFRSDLRLSLSAGTARFRRRSYDENHVRGQVGLRKSFDRHHRLPGRLGDLLERFSVGLDYLFDQVQITDFDDDAPPAALAGEGYTTLAYPRLEFRVEDLDFNYFAGPDGYRLLAQADYADSVTGSERDFFRVTGRADLFWSFGSDSPDQRHVVHAMVEGGRLRSLDNDATLISERYFLGGPRNFRGFAYRGVGPHFEGTPVGGGGMIRGSLEYSLPLFWRELRGVALFDWGEVAPSFSKLSTGRFRTAVGGGLRVRLRFLGQPLPANFYWVEAVGREREDRERLFLFSLGYAF